MGSCSKSELRLNSTATMHVDLFFIDKAIVRRRTSAHGHIRVLISCLFPNFVPLLIILLDDATPQMDPSLHPYAAHTPYCLQL